MSDDDSPPGPTESSAVGTTREMMRTVGDLFPGEDGDELAAEVDRVVDAVTPPGATAEEVDAVVFGQLSRAMGPPPEEEPPQDPIAVREHEDGYLLVVDERPIRVEVRENQQGVVVSTPSGEVSVPIPEGVAGLEWQSAPTEQMSTVLVRTESEDEDEEEPEEDAEESEESEGESDEG